MDFAKKEGSLMMNWIWLGAVVAFGVLEAATAALVSIWFVGGAAVALLASFLGAALWLQIALFLAVSVGILAAVRPLPFRADIAKPNRDNAIDVYIGDTPEDVIGDDVWAETFTEQPAPLTAEEKRAWLDAVTGVSLGSDAFFPFGDNIERARRSGVTAIVQPGGSIRDAQVIDTCNKYGIAMAFCGIRLFHH